MIDRAMPWHTRQWLFWLLPPALVIVLVPFILGLLNHWQLNRAGYWLVQRDWFLALNGALSHWPAALWLNLTELGDGAVLLILLTPLLIKQPQAWIAMVGAVPVAALLSTVGKHLAAIARPAAVLDPDQFTLLGHRVSAHNSLPSGHSITVFAAAIAILASLSLQPQCWHRWPLRLLVVLLASLVCLSRVAVGAHWPLDLLVGATAGWIAGLSGAALTRHYSGWWRWSQNPIGGHVMALVLLSASFLIIYQAQDALVGGVSWWLAGLCGAGTSLWLLGRRQLHTWPSTNTP